MINHEIVTIVAALIAAGAGFIFGRITGVDADHPTPRRPKQPASPYRDSAEPEGDKELEPLRESREADEDLDPLYLYNSYQDKIWLRCPHCQGGVTEFKTCTCDKIDSEDPHDKVHFHVTCPHCSSRFAMETAVAKRARIRAKQKSAEESKPKAN